MYKVCVISEQNVFNSNFDITQEQLQRVQEKIEQLYFRREQRLMELRQTQEKVWYESDDLAMVNLKRL